MVINANIAFIFMDEKRESYLNLEMGERNCVGGTLYFGGNQAIDTSISRSCVSIGLNLKETLGFVPRFQRTQTPVLTFLTVELVPVHESPREGYSDLLGNQWPGP